MELTEKLSQLEDEIKVLKNEVQAVLLDLRESCLNFENPFNPQASPASNQTIAVNLQSPANQPEPGNLHKITSKKTEPASTEPAEEDTPITDEPALPPSVKRQVAIKRSNIRTPNRFISLMKAFLKVVPQTRISILFS